MNYLICILFLCSQVVLAEDTDVKLNLIRKEINTVENELLSSTSRNNSANQQLGKIKKLISLQQKEIHFSEIRIKELTRSLNALSEQKQNLMNTIQLQKKEIHSRLVELNEFTEVDPIDANWRDRIEMIIAREKVLSEITQRDIQNMKKLKVSAEEATALEMRIIEEKSRMDFYLQELKEQSSLMFANEQVQKNILLTNRASRLETLKNLKELKEAEKELTNLIGKNATKKSKGTGFALLKGKIPSPIHAEILSGFGRSYNKKTSLFTFQKGLVFKSSENQEIKSVAEGIVAYSGPLKNYGSIVIIEHPGQYFTLYGQMGIVNVQSGADVKIGDVIGKSSTEPFYFEIRNKNIAINPTHWLANEVTLSKLNK